MYFRQTSENLANTNFTPGWLADFILHFHDNSVTSRMRMLFLIVEICACGTTLYREAYCISYRSQWLFFLYTILWWYFQLEWNYSLTSAETGLNWLCITHSSLTISGGTNSEPQMGTVFSMALVQKSPWYLVYTPYTLHFLSH